MPVKYCRGNLQNSAAGLTPNEQWIAARRLLATPFFDAIRSSLLSLSPAHWPHLTDLNALAVANQLQNVTGAPLRFVAAVDSGLSAMAYETQIAVSGNVPTRQNWHDLFNAMQWLAYPKTKAVINAAHAKLLASGGQAEARARSIPRDVLTMVDESGMIVASTDESLLQLIRDFQWKRLFVDRRDEVTRNMRFVLVGHGLLEKSLSPFVGLTAKAILLPVDQHLNLDEPAAAWLCAEANLWSARNLAPLPLLGIPGWDTRNHDPRFYDNTDYFRPGYRPPSIGRT